MREKGLIAVLASKGEVQPAARGKRSPAYRTADFHLNKLDILSELKYTEDEIGIPIILGTKSAELPSSMTAFSKAIYGKRTETIVHFYEADRSFARVMHNPKKYGELLKRFKYVVFPDFSQKLDMPAFIRFQNSWWNKALGAYWQSLGVNVIPNVSWSTPSSYEYAFKGIPRHSVIAINCTGIKGTHMSRYFWMSGYEAALKALEPSLIIRYGDAMPGEDTSRSVYFENENLKRLRNGGKR